MKNLKETLKKLSKRDIFLWVLIVILLFWMLSRTAPNERWEKGQRILFLTLLLYQIHSHRKKV